MSFMPLINQNFQARGNRDAKQSSYNTPIYKRLSLWVIIISITILLIFSYNSCKLINAANVGVKVNLYGDNKGIEDIVIVTGWVWYNPLAQKVYEFPTYIQHKEYSEENSFIINSKDGSEFKVSPYINYQVISEKVPHIFGKYRKDLTILENMFMKTIVYDAFRVTANSYTADQLIGNREVFEKEVKIIIDTNFRKEGFLLSQITSNLVYPETFKTAIEAKNNAVQAALTQENKVKEAEANAKIQVAQAEGQARSLVIQAKAEAEANKLRQQSLTPLLIQQMYIEKWDGVLPVYGTVPTLFKDVSMK